MNSIVAGLTTEMAPQELSSAGRGYRAAECFALGTEQIHAFARAIRDFHPAHWNENAAADLGFSGLIAPSTFASIILLRVHGEILDSLITGYESTRILHADQVLDIGRPLIAGDRLTCDVYFESCSHFADYDVLTIKAVLIDQHGEVVQTASTALLARSGDPGLATRVRTAAWKDQSPGGPRGTGDGIRPAASNRSPCPTIDFESLRVGTKLPSRVVRLSRADLVTYAGVTGDADALLLGQQSTAGLPTVVAPGMLKLGLTSAYLSDWLGDPAAVTRLRAQFAHYTHYLHVPPQQTRAIEFHGRVTSLDPRRRRATIAFDARSRGRMLFGYAAAEVRFPD